jgi:predicted phosphohydrolase
MPRLIFYHFSDLHFRTDEEFDRDIVIRALWSDIERQMKSGLVPDFIAVTGDISWSGRVDEYKRAESEFFLPLLDKTNLSRGDLFIVPGNHDVEREALSDVNPDRIVSLRDRDSVNIFIGQPRTLARYLISFETYKTFVSGLCGTPDNSSLAYCRYLSSKGSNTAIVGLNSAWVSGYQNLPNRGKTEQGHLIVGERQVVDALATADHAECVIALMHHPLSWLADFDKAAIQPILASRVDVVLHGHVHRPSEVSTIADFTGGYLSLGAGAAYDRRVGTEPYVNSYSIINLDSAARTATVTVRKYVDSPVPRWTSHEDLVGEGTGGVKTFNLPSTAGVIPSQSSRGARSAFTSLGDLLRSVTGSADFLSRAEAILKPRIPQRSIGVIDVFEQIVVSWVNEFEIKSTIELAAAILIGKNVLSNWGTSARVGSVVDLTEQAFTDILNMNPREDFVIALERARICWKVVSTDFQVPPHQLTQDSRLFPLQPAAVVPPFLGLSLLLLSDALIATAVLPNGIPDRLDTGEIVALNPPSSGRVREHVAQISVAAPTIRQFTAVSVIRFYLETRLEHLIDVFSAVNEVFPLAEVRLHLIESPKEWTELRFTVDAVQVMRLLMGSELYGAHSKDIWFRELLQNAIDATQTRSRIDDDATYSREIDFEYKPIERCGIFRDNGVGMSKDHILKFFCRAGRSIWRSDELKTYASSRTTTTRTSLGKFGIGFLSVFQVSNHIDVMSTFCKENDIGHALELTNLEQPFFLRAIRTDRPGTEIAIRFKEDYTPDFDELARRYITYQPQGVTIRGIDGIPEGPTEALDAMVRRTMWSWRGEVQNIYWQKAEVTLPYVNAHLYMAVPMTWANPTESHGPNDRPTLVDTTSIRVSNGGITVLEKNSEWLGEKVQGTQPSSNIRGVHALIDFSTGAAPVTVSRNELTLSESDARRIVDAIRAAALSAWRAYANFLFDDARDPELATRRLMHAMCNSAKPPSYWLGSDRWSSEDTVRNAARDILSEKGEIYVHEGSELEKRAKERMADLIKREDKIVVLSQSQRNNRLFHLHVSKSTGYRVVVASNRREVDLIAYCGSGWQRLASDNDLWSAMQIEEDKEERINYVIPAEMAIVSNEYFIDKSAMVAVLPIRRARAEQVEGFSRAEAREIRPRVLLNKDHMVMRTLEEVLQEDHSADSDVRQIFESLITGVVEENTKGRRSRRYKVAISRLLKRLGLPDGTEANLLG